MDRRPGSERKSLLGQVEFQQITPYPTRQFPPTGIAWARPTVKELFKGGGALPPVTTVKTVSRVAKLDIHLAPIFEDAGFLAITAGDEEPISADACFCTKALGQAMHFNGSRQFSKVSIDEPLSSFVQVLHYNLNLSP
jgi:hypothetical protein